MSKSSSECGRGLPEPPRDLMRTKRHMASAMLSEAAGEAVQTRCISRAMRDDRLAEIATSAMGQREILRQAVGLATPPRNLAAAIRARVASFGDADLDLPAREPMREPPRFGRGRG